jgi:ABC-2 type transport system ATP-binding protein
VTSASQPAVEVRGLRKRYGGRAVVDGVSFEVATGEVFALLGPNGAGKTTTIEILEGYRTGDEGSARVLGLDPRHEHGRLMARVGIMLQQGGVYPQVTAREALRLFAAFYPDPLDPDALIEQVGLGQAAGTRFQRLSGGEKQRLALALALVGRPELVFLDEPTASMDAGARRVTWAMLRGLRATGTTVFLTTHFIEEAERLADRVAILVGGRLVAIGAPDELRRRAGQGLRVATTPAVEPGALAAALGLDAEQVVADGDGLVVRAEPTPRLVAALTGWLAERDVLLRELQTGGGSLEEAFLRITAEAADVPSPPGSRFEARRAGPGLPSSAAEG